MKYRSHQNLRLFLLLALAAPGIASATSLAVLQDEAVHHNPEIAAALNAWQAAAQVPTQVSTLPDPQVTVQQFAVGSPQPFAGFNCADEEPLFTARHIAKLSTTNRR